MPLSSGTDLDALFSQLTILCKERSGSDGATRAQAVALGSSTDLDALLPQLAMLTDSP